MTKATLRAWPVVALVAGIAACGPDAPPAALDVRAAAPYAHAALKTDQAVLVAPVSGVTNDRPGVCLDVRNGSRAPGALVQLWDCDGGDKQRFVRSGNNLQIFDDMCLAVAEGRHVPGGGLQLEPCDKDSLNQGWLFEQAHVKLEDTELCMEVVAGVVTRGGAVVLAPCSAESPGQKFSYNEAEAVTGPGSPGSRRRAPAQDGNSPTHKGDPTEQERTGASNDRVSAGEKMGKGK